MHLLDPDFQNAMQLMQYGFSKLLQTLLHAALLDVLTLLELLGAWSSAAFTLRGSSDLISRSWFKTHTARRVQCHVIFMV